MDKQLPQPLIVVGVAALLLCGGNSDAIAQQQQLDRIVAVVENEAITERQLLKRLQRFRAMLAQQGGEIPDERILVGQVLQQMIILQLQLQEAQRLGISIDDISLDRAVENMAARNNLSLAQFKEKIERGGDSFEDTRQQIRNDLTIRQLIQNEVINRIEVSEREIQEALAQNNETRGAKYHFVQLRVTPQAYAGQPDAVKKRFARIHQKMRNASFSSFTDLRRHFAQLWREQAQEDGAGKVRYQIKDLNWQRLEELPTSLRQRIDDIRNKGISPVIVNAGGLHLFALLETRTDSPMMMQLQYRVRHILIQTTPIEDDSAVQRKLLNIKRKLEQGGNFEALACQFSQDPLSSMKGGDLGWSGTESYVAEFAEAVTRARGKGDIVGPFKSSFGWHILEVLDTRKHDVGDATVRRQAIARIKQGKSEEETRLWLLKLRENRNIEVRI